jgi:hypothetical protein
MVRALTGDLVRRPKLLQFGRFALLKAIPIAAEKAASNSAPSAAPIRGVEAGTSSPSTTSAKEWTPGERCARSSSGLLHSPAAYLGAQHFATCRLHSVPRRCLRRSSPRCAPMRWPTSAPVGSNRAREGSEGLQFCGPRSLDDALLRRSGFSRIALGHGPDGGFNSRKSGCLQARLDSLGI